MKRLLLISALSVLPTTTAIAQECSTDFTSTAPNTRFIDNDNGTILDLKTNLTWMRCPLGKKWNQDKMTCDGTATGVYWQSALNDVQAINKSPTNPLHKFGGKEEWRLPNIKELVSLKEAACYHPAVNEKAFPGGFTYELGDTKVTLWSSTPTGDGSQIMLFDTANGDVRAQTTTMAEYGVLLVSQ